MCFVAGAISASLYQSPYQLWPKYRFVLSEDGGKVKSEKRSLMYASRAFLFQFAGTQDVVGECCKKQDRRQICHNQFNSEQRDEERT